MTPDEGIGPASRLERTTSTEQGALAVTAIETLPMKKRSIPRRPFAPTKMQSAFQRLASFTRICFGLPSRTKDETANPVPRSPSAAL